MAKFDLDTIRHSTAHLMAQAVSRVFPDEKIQFGVGPVISNGFYYDIDINIRLTNEDLANIESQMHDIIKEDLEVKRVEMSKPEALEFWKKREDILKIELIEGFDDETISSYQQGEFIDLCRGPHVERTGQIPTHFKLLSIAGAYWKGDSSNKMLQRIYAACFSDRKELKKYLNFLEEAKKRDHRKLGKELELFHFEQVAPGSPFFMPKGAFIYNQLVEFIRRVYDKYGYSEVITPQILDTELWHTSGHYENYQENMFFTMVEDREYAVKPMNCPCHMLMFKHYHYSYRDLPLRFADFGRLHRNEASGSLAGLTRVRTFCQDDAHVFLPIDKIEEEILNLMDMFFTCYDHFGFKDVKINLSTRPEKRVGNDETWDLAENALKNALDKSGKTYHIKEGDGAFYGPKIDVEIADAIQRYYQLGTIQLDFQLPERFNLKFTNSEGAEERPVVIHRALLGSLERFFGIYLEHVGGAYPFWLAPTQAVIVPVNNDSHLEHCIKIKSQFDNAGLRVTIDERNESMGYKTRQI
ncbi:MAG: threonine--tRNA ligase, partial [Bdellovibrionales bacterium]|nr:threonine--tRNA ligase [Bdellovibrionales bacterium]